MSDCLQTERSNVSRRVAFRLQVVTLLWMLIECGVALYSATTAHSAALLAFGADSVVELLSATIVLFRFLPVPALSERKAARFAGILLLVLAIVVFATAVISVLLGIHAERSLSGIAITVAALCIMPVLAWLKRRESRRLGSRALAADAAQSATCAWLAFTALAGLAANALFHLWWLDPAAALLAVPLLIREGLSGLRGRNCTCC